MIHKASSIRVATYMMLLMSLLGLTRVSLAKAQEGVTPMCERFSQPDGYRPVPWWAWTGKLDPAQLERQLRQMHSQGIREFFIFPIYGMDIEYMSDAYLDRIGMVLGWCKELGMKAWIYDELNWPSGTAAGRVPRKHPDAVAAQIHLEDHPQASPDEVRRLLSDDGVLSVVEVRGDGTVVPATPDAAEARHVRAFRRQRDQTTDLTTRGCLWTRNEPGTLDLLSHSAVGAFIQEAYEPIAKSFPDDLGQTIAGFFTDEPHFAPGSIPFTDDFRGRFQNRFGYDIVDHLHDLVFDAPGCERYRIDYWSLASEMASDAYTGRLAAWCGARNMALTGHLIYEENSYSVWWHGDGPSHLLKMQVPGCDLLGPHTSYEEPRSWYHFGAKSLIKTPKNPASAARFTGRPRVMCEAYGVMPWWKAPADEKRVTDWLVALGVNLINDNSLITDICDFRKRGISGKHFTQPYWPYEHLYYDYAGRVCAVSANSVVDTELLLLYPSTTWWAHVRGGTETSPELRELELAFDYAADALVRHHWDFEFLFEQILEKAEVSDGALKTDHGSFRAVVMAGITYLRPVHAAKLEAFASAGGTVFIVGPHPEAIDKGALRPLNLPGAVSLSDWNADGFAAKAHAALTSTVSRPWNVEGSDHDGVISAARVDSRNGRYLFLANMTPGEKLLDIAWSGDDQVECWDPDSGARWTPEQRPGHLQLSLPEDQSVWLVRSANTTRTTRMPAHFMPAGQAAKTLDGPWDFVMDRPNLFSLEFRLKPDVEGTMTAESAALDEGWKDVHHGDAGIPLTPETMKAYWLSASFRVEHAAGDLDLVVDTELVAHAWLNGEALGSSEQTTLWDEHNRAWRLGGRVRTGENTVLLRVLPSPYNAARVFVYPTTIAEPVVLRGRFGVAPDGRLIAPPSRLVPGDWGGQGLPHFAGTGIYTREFDWPGGDALFTFDGGRGVVELLVDGRSLGQRAWGRRSFVADNLDVGEHRVEVRITNTLGGILRRYYSGAEVTEIPACGLLSPLQISRPEVDS